MSIHGSSSAGGDLNAKAALAKEALLSLQPNFRHQKTELFTLLYPTIVELLNKHVSQKAILEVLQTQGLKLHPSRFKALMAAHAETARTQVGGSAEEEAA
jgi:hypothetical protein